MPLTTISQQQTFYMKNQFLTFFPTYQHRNNPSTSKKVLLWTPLYGSYSGWEEFYGYFEKDSCKWKCEISINKFEYISSDVILFNTYDLSKYHTIFPHVRAYKQIWLLHNLDPPWKTYLDLDKYRNVFNWTSFLRRDSDIPTYYGKYIDIDFSDEIIIPAYIAEEKSRFAVWMARDCFSRNRRELVVAELKQYIEIDTYGLCGSKECSQEECDTQLKEYTFYLAFEDENCRDYITDHLWRPLELGIIPVVMGGLKDNYVSIAPPNSYIDASRFETTKSLAQYIQRVAKNKILYNSYFTWRKKYRLGGSYWCDLCQALHQSPRLKQVYTDIAGWHQQDICKPWNVSLLQSFTKNFPLTII